jgi:AAA family ATP:ADP antiporter
LTKGHAVTRDGLAPAPRTARRFTIARRAVPEDCCWSTFILGPAACSRSPYLIGVGAWVSLLSFCATIVYFEQANIVSAAVHDRDAQTRLFAGIDLAVNLLSLATQVFITGQLLKRFGSGLTAGALPAIYIVGFAALFLAPTLAVVVVVQVMQRWMNFAVANPARQVFLTVLGREEKYKAKNLIDVVVYRGSDALYGWVFDSLQALGLKLGAIALSPGR